MSDHDDRDDEGQVADPITHFERVEKLLLRVLENNGKEHKKENGHLSHIVDQIGDLHEDVKDNRRYVEETRKQLLEHLEANSKDHEYLKGEINVIKAVAARDKEVLDDASEEATAINVKVKSVEGDVKTLNALRGVAFAVFVAALAIAGGFVTTFVDCHPRGIHYVNPLDTSDSRSRSAPDLERHVPPGDSHP